MGKVSRRLTIVVFPPLGDWPEIAKLEEQGHTIERMPDVVGPDEDFMMRASILANADLVLGPPCWYFDAKHRKYLTSAIKQARLRRYGAPQRKEPKKDGQAENLEQ